MACSFSAMDHCRLFLSLDPVDELCSLVEGDGVIIVVIVTDDEMTGEEYVVDEVRIATSMSCCEASSSLAEAE